MDWKTKIASALARDGRTADDDVIEELAHHARAMYDAARADGASGDEAEARVCEQIERWRRDVGRLRRTARRPAAIEPPPASQSSTAGFVQDLRYAFRLLRRQPRFTTLASVTMALGIAATTLLFSVTYGVLIKPLPWPAGDRLVVLKETRGGKPPRFNAFSNAAYLAWRDQAATIDGIAAWSQQTVTLSGQGEPERLRITAATASLFTVLDARPLIGAVFTQADEVASRGNVVVLSEGLWRERFGADPAALGRAAHFDGQPYTIVGVLPDRLAYPDERSRAFVPFHVPPISGNSLSMFNAIAKLRSGVSASQAAAEATGRGRFVADTGMTTMAIFGSTGAVAISATPLKDALTSDVRQPLIVLFAAVGLLLITAAGNVAGLQLARAASRRREIAIRAALGAGSARVVRELLAESVVLGSIGAASGLVLAWLLHRLVPVLLPADFPRVGDLHLDATVIAFSIVVSGVVTIVFGLIPAWRGRRIDLVSSLAEDGNAPAGGGARSRVGRTRLAIMTGQVAIACVLLVGASLLGRSFVALLTADRGYDPSGVLTARLSMPDSLFKPERRYEIAQALLERLSAMPRVSDAAFTSELPLTAGGSTAGLTLRTSSGPIFVQASPRVVSPRVFAALGMRVIAGRGFSADDTQSAAPVAVVNRAFATRYLQGAAVGVKIPMGLGYQDAGVEAEIVGVVDDVRYLASNDATHPEIYYSYQQLRGRLTVPVVTLLVRAQGDPATLAGALRAAVRDADGTLVSEAVMTLEDRVLLGLARPRLYMVLLGGFAAFAIVIAGVGLFAVVSYAVAGRSRELAVRTALGAQASNIVGLVVRQGLTVALSGIVVGLVAAMVLTRSMATFLYGVTPYDAVTFVSVPLALLVVTAIACFVPARRATRLDPLRVLRSS